MHLEGAAVPVRLDDVTINQALKIDKSWAARSRVGEAAACREDIQARQCWAGFVLAHRMGRGSRSGQTDFKWPSWPKLFD